jgi:hypothetical protein
MAIVLERRGIVMGEVRRGEALLNPSLVLEPLAEPSTVIGATDKIPRISVSFQHVRDAYGSGFAPGLQNVCLLAQLGMHSFSVQFLFACANCPYLTTSSYETQTRVNDKLGRDDYAVRTLERVVQRIRSRFKSSRPCFISD